MSAITLINQVPASTVPSAEFRLIQGQNQIFRIGVHSGGQASIPLPTGVPTYTVKAVTRMEDVTLTSNTITITGASVNVLAQVQGEDGYSDFQLVQRPGTQPQAIVCESTCRAPVQFTLQVPGSPVQIVTVVDEHNNTTVSTAQQWQCYAIANGITTQTVTITDPNAVITLTADNNDDSYTLTVTGSSLTQATDSAASTKEDASAGATVIRVTPAA